MSEANKAVLRRVYDEVFSQGRFEVVDEVVAPDAVDHTPLPNFTGNTPEDLKGFARLMRDAFPDVRFRSLLEIAENDKVVIHYEMTGTQKGEFLGVPPSGGQVTVRGVDIVTVVDGRCTEHWGWDDSWQLMAAGGPPPA